MNRLGDFDLKMASFGVAQISDGCFTSLFILGMNEATRKLILIAAV